MKLHIINKTLDQNKIKGINKTFKLINLNKNMDFGETKPI